MTQGAPPPSVINFVDMMLGGPRIRAEIAASPDKTRLVQEHLANLRRWEDEWDAVSWPGEIGVWRLQEIDQVYLDRIADDYKLATGEDVMRDGIIEGRNVHLGQVRKNGSAWRGKYDLSTYGTGVSDVDVELKRMVEDRAGPLRVD